MNIHEMQLDANRLIRHWEDACKSTDLVGQSEWIHGIVYGLKLMSRLMQEHIDKGRKPL